MFAAIDGMLTSVFGYGKNATLSPRDVSIVSKSAGGGKEARTIAVAETGTGIRTGAEAMKMTAIVHTGADLLLRTAYCPDKFSHRVVLIR